jgi:hypothetical protein
VALRRRLMVMTVGGLAALGVGLAPGGAGAATVDTSGLVIPNPPNAGSEWSIKSGPVAPPLSGALAEEAAAKETAAANFNLSLVLATVNGQTQRVASAANMPADQMPQDTYYYCGPASIAEADTAEGYGSSGPYTRPQDNAAYYADTDSNGTNWYGYDTGARVPDGTGYPMVDALNWYNSGDGTYGYYTPDAIAYYPTSDDYTRFQNHLTYDIYNGWDVVGDAYEVQGGPHLVGHPNANIFHWFAIRGYDSNGANTSYEDSASGAPSVYFYQSVPPYSTMSTHTITDIIGGRGDVW